MKVRTHADGRRSVEMAFELPGTPEDVWQAIATGPGISSWFVPATVEERVGGAVAFDLGGGEGSSGHVTVWEPPRHFAIEEPGWDGDAPPLATDFLVEAQAGGTCRVRLVQSLFASGEDWDDQLKSFGTGWPPFFRVLALALRHFRGQSCSPIRALQELGGDEAQAWARLLRGLGLPDAPAIGQRVASSGDAPVLSGTVEHLDAREAMHELTLRLDAPAPGTAQIGSFAYAGKAQVAITLYVYGPAAADAAAREQPRWEAWLGRLQNGG